MSRELGAAKQEIAASVRNLGESSISAVRQVGELSAAIQEKQLRSMEEKLSARVGDMDKRLTENQQQLTDGVCSQLNFMQESLDDQLTRFNTVLSDRMNRVEARMKDLEDSSEKKLDSMRGSLTEGMSSLREENGRKLDEIKGTVDEKLQTTLEKRIAESFRTVNAQLEAVYKSLGEMQSIATDVGGLKKVLSGVKTRGILGEIQLGAILEEILTPDQYETNVATVPGSTERVEFAIRLPGSEGGTVWLPIDSKFPGDRYSQLVDARESGDREKTEKALRSLEGVLKAEARDIRDKYLSVPYTTAFGIMFLPFEGLYAEVVNRGLLEVLQRDFHVNVAGPSTMAALLNSLQMGFRTLAIQKRSGEVWEVLGAVKTEFEKFEESMKKMQYHLNSASEDLEKMMTTRSRGIQRKLRDVQKLEDDRASVLLELEES